MPENTIDWKWVHQHISNFPHCDSSILHAPKKLRVL